MRNVSKLSALSQRLENQSSLTRSVRKSLRNPAACHAHLYISVCSRASSAA